MTALRKAIAWWTWDDWLALILCIMAGLFALPALEWLIVLMALIGGGA